MSCAKASQRRYSGETNKRHFQIERCQVFGATSIKGRKSSIVVEVGKTKETNYATTAPHFVADAPSRLRIHQTPLKLATASPYTQDTPPKISQFSYKNSISALFTH
jgi:hypothetical protein